MAMISTKISLVFVVALIFSEGTRAQYFRSYNPSRVQYDSCSSALEDLSILLQLARAFEYPEPINQNNGLSEEIIMKLVNALVYTATQNCGGNQYNNGGTGTGSGSAGGGGSSTDTGTGSGSGGGLLGTGLGVGVGVGIGGGSGTGTGTGTGSGGSTGGGSGNSGKGGGGNNDPLLGINVARDGDLLDVTTQGKTLVGVGAGNGDGLVTSLLGDVL